MYSTPFESRELILLQYWHHLSFGAIFSQYESIFINWAPSSRILVLLPSIFVSNMVPILSGRVNIHPYLSPFWQYASIFTAYHPSYQHLSIFSQLVHLPPYLSIFSQLGPFELILSHSRPVFISYDSIFSQSAPYWSNTIHIVSILAYSGISTWFSQYWLSGSNIILWDNIVPSWHHDHPYWPHDHP